MNKELSTPSNKYKYHYSNVCILNSVSAFTLIEVLVSLALLTIVVGAVYSSFFSVQRALERFDSISLKYHEARTALDIMRREIEGSFVQNPGSEDAKAVKAEFAITDRDIFGKNTSSLNLTSFSFKSSTVNTLSYYVEEKEGTLTLLKTEAPAAVPSQQYSLDIIEDIKSFTVETFYNRKWVKTWDTADTGMLPEMVRISIEFDDNGTGVTLTEYARPRIGTFL